MSKFIETDYLSTKNILRFPDHYVAVAATVDDTGVTANADGKKIVSAGTIIGGVQSSFLSDPTQLVCEKNADGATGQPGAAVDAEGVLFSDVDVTYGPSPGAMIIHGFLSVDKLPEAPHANALKALSGRVVFLK